MAREHRCDLVSSFIDGGWQAKCWCGWEGEARRSIGQAAHDGDTHRLTVETASEGSDDGTA